MCDAIYSNCVWNSVFINSEGIWLNTNYVERPVARRWNLLHSFLSMASAMISNLRGAVVSRERRNFLL